MVDIVLDVLLISGAAFVVGLTVLMLTSRLIL